MGGLAAGIWLCVALFFAMVVRIGEATHPGPAAAAGAQHSQLAAALDDPDFECGPSSEEDFACGRTLAPDEARLSPAGVGGPRCAAAAPPAGGLQSGTPPPALGTIVPREDVPFSDEQLLQWREAEAAAGLRVAAAPARVKQRPAPPPTLAPEVDGFRPAAAFLGRIAGFVFHLGDRGLGYYRDRPPRQLSPQSPFRCLRTCRRLLSWPLVPAWRGLVEPGGRAMPTAGEFGGVP